MTKRKWLACRDARQMLTLLGSGASPRKLRLFACACCQAVLPAAGAAARAAVEAAERFADGLAARKDLTAARDRAGPGDRGSGPRWRQGVAFACFAAAGPSAYRAAEEVLTGTLIGSVTGPVRRGGPERQEAQRAPRPPWRRRRAWTSSCGCSGPTGETG